MRRALLVIGVQNAFFGDTEYNSGDVASLFAHGVNAAVAKALHDGSLVIYVRQEIPDSPFWRKLFPKSPIAGTEESKISEFIDVASEFIVSKKSQDAFSSAGLRKLLKDKKIEEVYICGQDAARDCCKTAVSAVSRGLRTFLIRPAVYTDTEKDSTNKWENKLTEEGVHFVGTRDFIHYGKKRI